MADAPFNIAKGRAIELVNRVANNDPANSAIVLVMLKVAEADATLEDYDDLAALLAGSNTEADFTNYARKVFTDADLSAAVPDDTNNWQSVDMPDWVIASAGGTTDNTLVKVLVCYDSDTTTGTDANIIPIAHYDYAITTNGADLSVIVNTAGFYRAT